MPLSSPCRHPLWLHCHVLILSSSLIFHFSPINEKGATSAIPSSQPYRHRAAIDGSCLLGGSGGCTSLCLVLRPLGENLNKCYLVLLFPVLFTGFSILAFLHNAIRTTSFPLISLSLLPLSSKTRKESADADRNKENGKKDVICCGPWLKTPCPIHVKSDARKSGSLRTEVSLRSSPKQKLKWCLDWRCP